MWISHSVRTHPDTKDSFCPICRVYFSASSPAVNIKGHDYTMEVSAWRHTWGDRGPRREASFK